MGVGITTVTWGTLALRVIMAMSLKSMPFKALSATVIGRYYHQTHNTIHTVTEYLQKNLNFSPGVVAGKKTNVTKKHSHMFFCTFDIAC